VDADTGGRPLNPCYRPLQASFTEPTYNLSVEWKVTPDALLYVTHARGYKSGGLDVDANTPTQTQPFLPEIVEAYEAGAKTEWRFGEAYVRANVAAFYEDYTNIQRTLNRITPVGVSLIAVVNAASAKIKGGEAELLVSPVRPLELSLNWAYLRPKYEKFIGPGNADLSPAGFAASPKNTFSGYIRYHQDLEGLGRFSAILSGYHQDWMWALEGASNYNATTKQYNPHDRIPGYTIYKARVELSNIKDRDLSVALYVDNLTNKHYFTGLVDVYNTLGFSIQTLGEPRTWGLEVKYGF
jgi:iron complex outermembrane receptor protein